MVFVSISPEENFAEASSLWDLERLYGDCEQHRRLTFGDKEYLRGLLLGLRPSQIATQLQRDVGGVRVALCPIYRLIEILLGQPERTINSNTIVRQLEQAGYRRTASSQVQPTLFPVQADLPPSPAIAPEHPWGQVRLESDFYIDRPPIEADCYQYILKPGALIRIQAPRQMGKTSLMSRILQHAEQHECRTVSLSFQLADRAIFASLDKFLRWFCRGVSGELGLPGNLDYYWDETFGSKMSCRNYFQDYVLPQVEAPLVLALDEVDRIFAYPELAQDFFGLLRAWHEAAANSPIWQKLRLIIVHSTEVSIPLDPNQSPFNVGLPIHLPEFRPHQVWDLVNRHELSWNAEQIEDLFHLVGGHPYLTRLACYKILRQDMTLEELIQAAPTDTGPYAEHLQRHLQMLEKNPDLAAAIALILQTDQPVRLESRPIIRLLSLGLIRLVGNQPVMYCELYRQYFRDRLVPD